MQKSRLIPVILGPTSVGKTDFSVELALTWSAEVISCDSRQVYIGMDIGTAKTPYHIREIIPHHLIDIIYPSEEFNAKTWAIFAEKCVKKILRNGRTPLILCGTGLYLKAFTDGFFPLPPLSKEKREEINHRIEKIEKKGQLFNYLKKTDPESALTLHPNDKQRIKRAIEIYLLTEKPLSYHKRERQKRSEDFLYIGLTTDRKLLYKKINQRVDIMLKQGFIEEVHYLLSLGYNHHLPAFQTPGYRELIKFLNGQLSRDEAIKKTKTLTRNYAKRQLTWFRKMKTVNWFDVSFGYKRIYEKVKYLFNQGI